MKAFAWRRETTDPKANYCLQVENIKGKRALNKVVKILGDWEIIGDGYNAKTEEYTMIFAQNFDNPRKWQAWAEEFPIRCYGMLASNDKSFLQEYFSKGHYSDEYLNIRSVKAFIDGALGSRGAALHEPYCDDTNNCGLILISQYEFNQLA